MIEAELPSNEIERLKKLRYFEILDTSDEELFDNVAQLASHICGVPIALISLIDDKRQWFKAKVGLQVPETDRKIAFCAHAILSREPFVVRDSREDNRFADNPLVTGDPNIVFYAGYPLETEDEFRLGTLCVIDHIPRSLTEEQSAMMKNLAKQTIHLLKLRENLKIIEEERQYATQANAAKRDFIAAISHDIRNPLNSLMGISDMLENTTLDDEQLKYVRQFKNSGEVILKIVNDVIYLSQLESKETSLDNHLFSIKRCMDSLQEFYDMETGKKGIGFEVFYNGDVKDFYIGDERKFEKIIWNLTANAVKFTNQGKITINISSKFTNGSEILCFCIEDSGPGISEKVLPNLFQKYNSFTPEECQILGSGLGLSIVKLATEKIGGTIEVDSKLGVGTKFTVSLPLQKGTPDPSRIKNNTHFSIQELYDKFHDTEVLISDDNDMNRMVLKSYLKGIGLKISEAADGKEAFSLAVTGKFKILFLDVEIPGMSGTELALTLRKMNHNPTLIACTGLCMPEEKAQILGSGFNFYLPKPYVKMDLFSILSEIKL
jgi:signal transduction histidine kinase/CheY-like chemotaxis protein